MISIGVIDTMGLVNAVEALDVCLKTAEVKLVSCEQVKGGIVSFTITGDVAAVKSAVDAGVAAAERLGGYLNHTVIARIDEQTDGLLEAERKQVPAPGVAPQAVTQALPQTEAKPAAPVPAAKAAAASQVEAKPVPEKEAPAAQASEKCVPVDAKVDVVPEPEPKAAQLETPAVVKPETPAAAPQTETAPASKAPAKPKAKPKAKAKPQKKAKPKTTAKKAPKKPDAKA